LVIESLRELEVRGTNPAIPRLRAEGKRDVSALRASGSQALGWLYPEQAVGWLESCSKPRAVKDCELMPQREDLEEQGVP
jgi:hypothetical protein